MCKAVPTQTGLASSMLETSSVPVLGAARVVCAGWAFEPTACFPKWPKLSERAQAGALCTT